MNSNQQLVSSIHDQELFQRVAVVGLGLIGGSLVKSLRRAMPNCRLIGVDFANVIARTGNFLDQAFLLDDLSSALREVDLVFLATPISVILRVLPEIATMIRSGTVVTDVGSTKHLIVEEAQKHFLGDRHFIGGHPLAGSEKGGWENADPYLFENAVYVLTPPSNFPPLLLNSVESLLQAIGAKVITLDPQEHDRIAADVSHLPQLLAVALTNFIARESVAPEPRLKLAAGGFRDMTRIAASPFEIWKDILTSNRANVRQSLQQVILTLQNLLRDFDGEAIAASFQRANEIRQRIPRDTRGFLQPRFDLTVSVPDRPGEIARLATALAGKNINIKDIEVLKVREGEGGTLRLAFDSEASREQAIEILQRSAYHSLRRD
jgi:prephenate dehydrogenase